MIELNCLVKHDDWGKLGSSSFVGQLLKSQQRIVNESTPYAELWMGTHKSGPSRVTNLSPDFDSKPIDSVLKAWPEFVGNINITQKYGQNLPILVKILSVDRPLPLRVNINQSDADSKSSKIVIALTSGSLLCGFKSHRQIVDNLEKFSILNSLINPSIVSKYKQSVDNNQGDDCDLFLTECFNEALQFCQLKQLDGSSRVIDYILNYRQTDETISVLRNLINKNLSIYGLVALFFLNLVNLSPDQAIIIPTNQIHTYLDGNYLEVSNPNDEVITESNLKDYISWIISPESPKFINPICLDDTSYLYCHQSSDLNVELINSNDDDFQFTSSYKVKSTSSGSFILVLGLTQIIVNNVYKIKPGQIFFVPPGLPLQLTHMRDTFRLFRVSLKS